MNILLHTVKLVFGKNTKFEYVVDKNLNRTRKVYYANTSASSTIAI